MRYKKLNFLKMFCFLAFFLGISVMRAPYALGESNGSGSSAKPAQASSESISRGRTFGNDTLCIETFEYSPETEFLNANNEKLYKKTLKVIKEFRTLKKNEFKPAAQWKYQFVFTYDKKSFVAVEEPDKDIDIQATKNKWSIMDLKEIFLDDKICLVSVKSVLYKENMLGFFEHVVDGHADIFCTAMGNIGINTDLH